MKPGRNDPCPCGSGKKYKHCHMQADEAPRPEELTWRRLHRAIEGLSGRLLNVATRHFGPSALHEAWEEFNLWPDEELEFDPESADIAVFLPWFLYDWLPDSEDTQVPAGAHGMTVAQVYLAGEGRRVEPLVRRYVEACVTAPFSFHEVLSCEPGRGFRLRDVLLGSEADVIEHGGSVDARPGILLFAKVVPIDGIAVLDGCTPVLISPEWKPAMIELRAGLGKGVGLTPAALHEFDLHLIELYFEITNDMFDPPLLALANTDGDPLEFHELVFDIDSPRTAFDALIDLAAGMSAEELLSQAEFDDAGELVRAQIAWRKLGNAAVHPASGNTILGLIEIEPGCLRARANSAGRAAEMRSLIEARLGARGRFRIASIQSMESSKRQWESADERAALDQEEDAAPLAEDPEVKAAVTGMIRDHYRTWVDQAIPALRGRTPREAVRDADGREAVAALILELEREGARMRPPLDPAIVRELRDTLGLAGPP